MKRAILILTTFLFFSATTEAQGFADSFCYTNNGNFYAKFLSGANFLQNTANDGNHTHYLTGYIISGSLGYRWCNGLSLEGEYAYRRNTISKVHFADEGVSHHGHCQSSSYMANLLWDFPLSTWGCSLWDIQPFFGIGMGYDLVQMHSSNSRIVFNQKWKHFSWQIMTGLAYKVFCNTEITLGYIFHQGGNHFYNHTLGVGLVYNFDFSTFPSLR